MIDIAMPCIGDIVRARDIIFRLHLLGWTQEEIGKIKGVELSQDAVSLRLRELPNLVKLVKDGFAKKKPIGEMAQYYNIGETLTWALVLQELSDEARFEALGFRPQLYNVWNFAGCDDRMGQDHAGRIPGQIVLNTLYYYAKPDDFFYSMAGSDGYVPEHRLVVAKSLGRCLQPWEIVHHKGVKYTGIENKQDNRYPENLELTSSLGEHSLSHSKGYRDGFTKGYSDGRDKKIKELLDENAKLRNQIK